jgi:hypothetical protein
MTIQQLLEQRKASPEDTMKLFDSLDAVDFAFMQGRWRGYEIATGHPMDGLLDVTGWYGKAFISPEEVHPLLFYKRSRKGLYSVNPLLIPLSIRFPKINALGFLMTLLSPILQTRKPKARMRMVVYRGKLTGAMVYDHKAIIDSFVKIDDNTMLGSMDQKGELHSYVFVLERDSAAYKMNF